MKKMSAHQYRQALLKSELEEEQCRTGEGERVTEQREREIYERELNVTKCECALGTRERIVGVRERIADKRVRSLDERSHIADIRECSLKDSMGECAVCLNKSRSYIFIGCGHLCVCDTCAPQLNCCPICRKVSSVIRVFM